MRKLIHILLMVIISTACSQNTGTDKVNKQEQKIKQKATVTATGYILEKLKDATRNETGNGLIIFSSGDVKYLIDPSYIQVGEIDDDKNKDAIVTLFTSVGQRMPLKEHLIMINQKGALKIARVLNGEMKFLPIADRTLFIETSKMAPDSPFADCQVCKEIKKYKFVSGDTVRIK